MVTRVPHPFACQAAVIVAQAIGAIVAGCLLGIGIGQMLLWCGL